MTPEEIAKRLIEVADSPSINPWDEGAIWQAVGHASTMRTVMAALADLEEYAEADTSALADRGEAMLGKALRKCCKALAIAEAAEKGGDHGSVKYVPDTNAPGST